MEDNQVLLKTKGYRVMDSMEQTLKYGVTVYQVLSQERSSVWHPVQVSIIIESADCLEYETSSKAKANAVCEYLTLKAEQETLAQQLTWEKYQQGGVDERTFIPHSIKC
jgi:hypothetical protein